jgi:hydrogenase-4 transcriptional activator
MQDNLLVEVWREACRHIELHDSTSAIADLISKRIPISEILIRRLTIEPSSMITIAGQNAEGRSLHEDRRELNAADAKRVKTWCESGDALQGSARSTGIAKLLMPISMSSACLLIPLNGRYGSCGVLILTPPNDATFSIEQSELLTSLREPFSVALDNDLHIHELNSLRAAAESERGALLQKLGRKELTDVIVGEQAGLRMVMERVNLIAGSDVPILILGETGTGKELIARAVHTRGKHHHGPFIRVNCGAIPTELIDSQLFGHEKGSFTGADQSRSGWFERADGGTLFLDEIGELPLDAQVRLLRVLQDGFVERVGGQHPIHVSVRVVAATHRELASMVREGTFREDLWYRIAVFPILLPPLRERLNDIPPLVEHFSERAAHRFGLPFVDATPDNLSILQSYDWPGNIRELGAVIDRAVILGGGKKLDVATALGFGATLRSEKPSAQSSSLVGINPSAALASLDEVAKTHIELVLTKTRGKVEGKGGAADILKINPHTLRARMRKLKIDWSKFRDSD